MKLILLSLALTGFTTSSILANDRPNILWLSAEDINDHFGCYGDPHAVTPNLDQLATEGVRYTNAYTAAGVCAPCRSTIITGMYQTTIGTMHMRSSATMPESIKAFPNYLREAGYYCTNNSKKDYQFKESKDTWDTSSSKAHWSKRNESSQPFFAVFNFTGCHESGIENTSKYQTVTKKLSPSERQNPEKFTNLPPYYPDTPIVREDWKRNYELITAMDSWVGDHIQRLKDDGLYEDTIIIYWSDHGVGLPRAKRWLYDSGTRVPLIIRIPKKWRIKNQGQPGTVDNQLISSLDFGITTLNLAGLPAPAITQGRAFLGKDLSPPRDYIYGARDRMDERYDIIRSVRDKRYRYIRNYEPLKPYFQYMNTPEKGATMKELRRISSEGNMPPAMKIFMADRKPTEEFYDIKNDPHEINNLIDDPSQKENLTRFRKAHTQWIKDTRDLGLIPEPEMELREKQAGSRYAILANTSDKTLPERLGKMASLASEGPEASSSLLAGLKDKDSAVRYWAATGIGNIGIESDEAVDSCINLLKTEPSTVVRIATARALLRIKARENIALKELSKALESPEEWSRLHAAIALDEADEQARPALASLKKALTNQPNKYIVRVANKAVNDLEETDNKVK
ncbi:sulfatase-like hydrolase/transferase [Akkermansiaceae bacterium]|nr:sulfatase-like hydrolase/transferase [Akkermansiaceae bacterium]MDB4332410.1 sulfatase-like hydrolase/transferase [Akkermansiaceae bacterium]